MLDGLPRWISHVSFFHRPRPLWRRGLDPSGIFLDTLHPHDSCRRYRPVVDHHPLPRANGSISASSPHRRLDISPLALRLCDRRNRLLAALRRLSSAHARQRSLRPPRFHSRACLCPLRMSEPPIPGSDSKPSFGGRWTYAVLIVALLFVLMPFLFWNATWFGRPLTDEQISKSLADRKHAREIQHALTQI